MPCRPGLEASGLDVGGDLGVAALAAVGAALATADADFTAVDVRPLRDLALVHPPTLREIARYLVPPDGAALLLLAIELGLLRLHLANEAREIGFVVARWQHRHGMTPVDL